MEVSINGGTPKSSILEGFPIINHPFWGTPICGTPQIIIVLHLTEMRPISSQDVHPRRGRRYTVAKVKDADIWVIS